MSADYRAGMEAAAKLADMYAEENFLLAGDTILTDPVLSGRDRSEAGFRASEAMMMDGHMHSSMAHAAQNIAALIRRSLPDAPRPDAMGREGEHGR